jgi:hypothetical protein
MFAAQGALLLLIYWVRGFDTNPDSLPLGLELDPRQAVIHLLFGIIGAAIGFWQPEGAVPFTVFFGLFYIALAIFGTFTPIHFGMWMWQQRRVNLLIFVAATVLVTVLAPRAGLPFGAAVCAANPWIKLVRA